VNPDLPQGSAADLVAALVRRADAADERARQAEARAEAADFHARRAELEAELYRQLRIRVRRWMDAGLVPEADRDLARDLCDHATLARLRAAEGAAEGGASR
jgi:hypothetical protein